MVWDEANLVIERINRDQSSTAILLKMAVSAIFDEDAGKQFDTQIKKLTKG